MEAGSKYLVGLVQVSDFVPIGACWRVARAGVSWCHCFLWTVSFSWRDWGRFWSGTEPRSTEGLSVGGPSTTPERDYMASRSVFILPTSAFKTLGSPSRKKLARAPKQAQSELNIKNKLSMVFNAIPCRPLKKRRARLMYFLMLSASL